METSVRIIDVLLNGQPAGHVSVPERASLRDIRVASLSAPEVVQQVGDEGTIAGFQFINEDTLNIIA